MAPTQTAQQAAGEKRTEPALDVQEDLDFEKKSWIVQRVGWAGLVAVMVAAALGLLGSGPLSRVRVDDPTGALHLDYHRLIRYHAPTVLRVRLGPEATQGEEALIWLDRRYVGDLLVEQITPPPVAVQATDQHTLYVFPVLQPGKPLEIAFHVQPDRPGTLAGRIGLVNQPQVSFRQFVFP